jgi:hypothetical protein
MFVTFFELGKNEKMLLWSNFHFFLTSLTLIWKNGIRYDRTDRTDFTCFDT